MERDFLGLNAKESSPAVKEENKEGSKDSGFARGSGMQWPFSNKVSALPQLVSFKTVQEDRAKKIVFDPLSSSAFMPTISMADAFDANHKPTASILQKNFNLDRQLGNHNAVTTYPMQHIDSRAPNQSISVSICNPFFKTQVATTGQSLPATALNQQPFGGIPVTTSHAIFPSNGSIEPRNISKPTGAQMTIFYGGSVLVYDDVSPEKAQSIMFLAGNGTSVTNQRPQVPTPTVKAARVEAVHENQSLPRPPSVTSQSRAQSGSGSSNSDEGMAAKSIGTLATPSSSQSEAPIMGTPVSSTSTTLMPTAVPQARKASLARFLEKRKERILSVAPYSPNNKSTESITAASLSFTTSKEQSWCVAN